MKKTLAVVFGLAVVAAIAWMTLAERTGGLASNGSTASGETKGGTNQIAANALPPSAVLKIDPRANSTTTGASTTIRTQALAKLSPLMQAYVERKNLPDVFRRAEALPESGEAAFIKAEILERCVTPSDAAASPPQKSLDERRKSFIASLPLNHPDNTMRINAFDVVNQDRCGDLKNLPITKAEIAALYAKASEAKDATALARDLNCELTNTSDPAKNGSRALSITPEQFERLQQSMRSKSPAAIRVGVGMLGNTYRNGSISIGDRLADSQALHHTANLLACQYGDDCSSFPLRACARQGRCATSNYEDYMAFYDLSPNAAQRVEEYRAEFTRMIEAGDFSTLRLTLGDQNTDSVSTGSYYRCP